VNEATLQRIQDAASKLAILSGNVFMYGTVESMLIQAIDSLEDLTYNQIVFPNDELPTIIVMKTKDKTVMISMVVGMIPPHESIATDTEA